MKKYFFGFIVFNLSWFTNETSAQDSSLLKQKGMSYILYGTFEKKVSVSKQWKGILYRAGA